jgi:hypothetical protein
MNTPVSFETISDRPAVLERKSKYAEVRRALPFTLNGGALKVAGKHPTIASSLGYGLHKSLRVRTRMMNGDTYVWIEKKA